jgi:hypothetical protein
MYPRKTSQLLSRRRIARKGQQVKLRHFIPGYVDRIPYLHSDRQWITGMQRRRRERRLAV